MYARKLNTSKALAGERIWTVDDGRAGHYLAKVSFDFTTKSWKVEMSVADGGPAVLHALAKHTPSDADLAVVFTQRARDLKGQAPQLLSVDFDDYAAYAHKERDEHVKDPQRFIITDGQFGAWSGTIEDLLAHEASYQRAVNYLYDHALLDPQSDDDYPSMGEVYQAMTYETVEVACGSDTVFVTDLVGDVIDSLDTLQAIIEADDGREREVALAYRSQMVGQLVEDTNSISLVARLVRLDEDEVLACIRQARE